MKQLLIMFVFCLLAVGLTGQAEIEAKSKVIRSNSLQVNTLVGSSKIGLGIKYKSLYDVKNLVKVGWGVGLDSYSSGIKRNFIPLSVELIGDIFEGNRTPFYMFSMGYGIPLKEEAEFAEESKGGLMVDVSLGYRSKKNKTQPFVAVGYRMQKATYTGEDAYGNDNKNVLYKRWSISAGLLF